MRSPSRRVTGSGGLGGRGRGRRGPEDLNTSYMKYLFNSARSLPASSALWEQ